MDVITDNLNVVSTSIVIKANAAAPLHFEILDADVIGSRAKIPAISCRVVQAIDHGAPFVCGFERDPGARGSATAQVYEIGIGITLPGAD